MKNNFFKVLPFYSYLLQIHTTVVIIKVKGKIVVFKYFSCLYL
jgi:hypothetical protein